MRPGLVGKKEHVLLWLMFFLAVPGPVLARDLTWTGCGITRNAFMNEIAAAYREKTGTTIKVSGGGATKGIRSVAAGNADMGGTCRDWLGGPGNKHPMEANAELIQVGWDALVAIVHPDNPVNDISLEELTRIYDGKIASWRELGGQDKPIALVTRAEEHSGVGYMFRLLAFNDPQHEYKARSYRVKSSTPVEIKVAKTPTAMGIDGISSAKKSKVKILSLNGVKPTKAEIASGRYPLFRPLYIAINKDASKETREVIDFILSREGQAIISEQGTVNLEEGQAPDSPWKPDHFFSIPDQKLTWLQKKKIWDGSSCGIIISSI